MSNFAIASLIIFVLGTGLFLYALLIARKLKKNSKQHTYDIQCSDCGQQLDCYECKDRDGDKVIFVTPHSCHGTDPDHWE